MLRIKPQQQRTREWPALSCGPSGPACLVPDMHIGALTQCLGTQLPTPDVTASHRPVGFQDLRVTNQRS